MASILSETQFITYHLHNKCRICLTDNLDEMTDLNTPLNNDTKLQIHEALETVMGEDVLLTEEYPNTICGVCLSLLSIAYDLKVQYFKSKDELLALCNEAQNNECSDDTPTIKQEQESELSVESTESAFIVASITTLDPEEGEDLMDQSPDDTEDCQFVEEMSNDDENMNSNVEQNSQPDVVVSENETESSNCCGYCKRAFPSAQYLRKHKIVCEKFDNLECYICKEKFEDKKHLVNHIRSLHLIDKNKTVEKNNVNDVEKVVRVVKKHVDLHCKRCNKLCSNRKSLAYHMSTHKEKQFGCEKCGKMFGTKGIVDKHMQIHKRETKVVCPVCGKAFHYDSGLFYHMKVHTNERNYQCAFCAKTFYNMCGLKRHERTHTGEKPFICQYCGRGFRSTGELKNHVYLHTGERPFQCHLCAVGFTKPYNLNIHLMTHEGDHKCHICKKGFINPQVLIYHLRIKHGIKTDKNDSAVQKEDSGEFHNEEEEDEEEDIVDHSDALESYTVLEEEDNIEGDEYYDEASNELEEF